MTQAKQAGETSCSSFPESAQRGKTACQRYRPIIADKSELVNAIIEARTVQMETEDTAFAIEWLIEHYHHMSLTSAERALEDQTFRHPALYPEGHPGLEAIRAEQRAKGRRNYQLKKLRPQIIDRDDSRCQNCNARVKGTNATLDHKDPEGPSTLENLHLLCRKCNTLKGNQSWDEFQKEQEKWKKPTPRKAERETRLHLQANRPIRQGQELERSGMFEPQHMQPVQTV